MEFVDNELRYQKSTDDEKHVDADIAAGKRGNIQMIANNANHCDRAQAINIRPIR